MAVTIPVKEFAERRRKLMDRMAPDSIAILPAAPERVRNRDVLHPFRQDSDFQYLTGFGEPEAVLALIPGREHGEAVLFCKERNPERIGRALDRRRGREGHAPESGRGSPAS